MRKIDNSCWNVGEKRSLQNRSTKTVDEKKSVKLNVSSYLTVKKFQEFTLSLSVVKMCSTTELLRASLNLPLTKKKKHISVTHDLQHQQQ